VAQWVEEEGLWAEEYDDELDCPAGVGHAHSGVQHCEEFAEYYAWFGKCSELGHFSVPTMPLTLGQRG
jgi:hypothetical protein